MDWAGPSVLRGRPSGAAPAVHAALSRASCATTDFPTDVAITLLSTLPSSRRSLSCRPLGSKRACGGRSRTRAVFHTTGIDVCQHRANTRCIQGASETCWATRQLRWSRRARWRKGFRQTSSPVEDHRSRGSDQIVPSRYRQCLRSHIRCSRQRAALRGRSSSGFVEVCHSGNYAANRSGLHRGPPA